MQDSWRCRPRGDGDYLFCGEARFADYYPTEARCSAPIFGQTVIHASSTSTVGRPLDRPPPLATLAIPNTVFVNRGAKNDDKLQFQLPKCFEAISKWFLSDALTYSESPPDQNVSCNSCRKNDQGGDAMWEAPT